MVVFGCCVGWLVVNFYFFCIRNVMLFKNLCLVNDYDCFVIEMFELWDLLFISCIC